MIIFLRLILLTCPVLIGWSALLTEELKRSSTTARTGRTGLVACFVIISAVLLNQKEDPNEVSWMREIKYAVTDSLGLTTSLNGFVGLIAVINTFLDCQLM